jgi:hypothetical protein
MAIAPSTGNVFKDPGFSVDTLIEMLGHAGASVSFVVTQRGQVA